MDGVPRAGWLRHPLEPSSEIDVPGKILEQLPKWRKSWDEIWYVHLSGENYVWRSPTRRDAIEYDLNRQSTLATAIDQLLKACLLHPEVMADDMSATDFLQLHELIWTVSGYRDAEFFVEKLYDFEQIVRSGDQVNILLLLRAFPGLLPDEINSWQPEKLVYHVALARAMLGIEPLVVKQAKRGGPQRDVPDSPEVAQAPPMEGPKPAFDWEKDLKEQQVFEH